MFESGIMASMRPGQLTPENKSATDILPALHLGFNEAGAINPGKLDQLSELGLVEAVASMRPGQLTPENDVFDRGVSRLASRFNEAGAINPGKRRLPVRDASDGAGFNEAGAINPGKHVGVEVVVSAAGQLQ